MFGSSKKIKHLEAKIKILEDSITRMAESIPELRGLLGEYPVKKLDLNGMYYNYSDKKGSPGRRVIKLPNGSYRIFTVTSLGDLLDNVGLLFYSEDEVLDHMVKYDYFKVKA